VTLRIEDANGMLLAIEGNPGTVTLDEDLPADPLGAEWWWHNWCSGHDSFVYRFTGGGKEVTMSAGSGPGPRCDDPGHPSLLSSIPQN
jgi:hypothetical protein